MAMARGANGILASTLCVDDVDLGATWSSNKGGHRAQGGTTHGHAPRFLCSKLGGQVWPTSLGRTCH